MVIEHDAYTSALFVGCAPSTLDKNSVYVCVSITGLDVVGETGVGVEYANEVLDELDEEHKDGGTFALEEDDVDEGGVGMVVTSGGAEEGGRELCVHALSVRKGE